MPPRETSANVPTAEAAAPEDLAKRVADLEAALAAAQAAAPLTLVPLHGAGLGTEVAETWSQADQEAARAEA